MSKWILGHYGISSSAEKAFHFRNTVLVLIKLGHKFRPVLYLWIRIFPLLEVKPWTFKKTQLPQTRAATDASCCEGGKACLWAGCLVHWAGTASESWRGSRENLTERARQTRGMAGWCLRGQRRAIMKQPALEAREELVSTQELLVPSVSAH